MIHLISRRCHDIVFHLLEITPSISKLLVMSFGECLEFRLHIDNSSWTSRSSLLIVSVSSFLIGRIGRRGLAAFDDD